MIIAIFAFPVKELIHFSILGNYFHIWAFCKILYRQTLGGFLTLYLTLFIIKTTKSIKITLSWFNVIFLLSSLSSHYLAISLHRNEITGLGPFIYHLFDILLIDQNNWDYKSYLIIDTNDTLRNCLLFSGYLKVENYTKLVCA